MIRRLLALYDVNSKKVLLLGFVSIAIIFILGMPSPLPQRVGTIDFSAYWSASYLLSHRDNFSDHAQLLQVEREQTGFQGDAPLMIWNPPWVLVMLIPYTGLPFARATWWWMLTGIVLIFIAAVMLWELYGLNQSTKRLAWIAVLIAFGFSPTLFALVQGQSTPMLLAGIAGSLMFAGRRREGIAGIALVLTMVKPHVVYLALLLFLLEQARRKQWSTWFAFGLCNLVLVCILFLLRPTFLGEYLTTLSGGGLLGFEPPTLGAFFALILDWQWLKLVAFLVIPIALWLWWCDGSHWNFWMMIDVSLFVSVMTMPFGWSYDFIVLLVPLLHVVAWIIYREIRLSRSIVIVLALTIVMVLSYYERVYAPAEVFFFWMPLAIAIIYLYAARAYRKNNQKSITMI